MHRDLERRGVRFHTASETEVVLNSFIADGHETFGRFRGMFALVIWNRETAERVAARDQQAALLGAPGRACPGIFGWRGIVRSSLAASNALSLRGARVPPAAATVPPDSPKLFGRGISRLIDDRPLGERLAATAGQRASSVTCDVRAGQIAFIEDAP